MCIWCILHYIHSRKSYCRYFCLRYIHILLIQYIYCIILFYVFK
nr:MAG TPA: hypothetical protein [Caudoviricetes sp.]DAH85770.1 MAG TPA: hypothetical protein [Bacteriophage sp.]